MQIASMEEENPATGYLPEPITLSQAALDELPPGVSIPRYDRTSLSPGIVHIGLGNFHRAHQAWYLHRLMQMGCARDWAIVGAGVRPYDAVMRDKLKAQDYLTTLIELDPKGTSAEVLGSMIDYVPIEPGNRALITTMSDPAIRIVALTITEGGYYIDPANGGFDTAHPDIVHDAANPDHPRTAFGAMLAALRNRRDEGALPFTGLSCDNLQGNGDILRQALVSLARMSNPELADWIDREGAFPNSMVDCIVPATGPDEIALARNFGIADAAPVTHENFRQWVIEDEFVSGRPDWGAVGATLTDNVDTYESMKIRILNAGHQVLANVGELLSVPTIAECMTDPDILAFWRKIQRSEIAPYVSHVPELAPEKYVNLVADRFANPSIRDTTRRVAFDGSSRHSGFIVPIIRDAINAGNPADGLALVEALWARMCFGTREDGSRIKANDPAWAKLVNAAQAARQRPGAWLEQEWLYGDLSKSPEFSKRFRFWLNRVWEDGSRKAIRVYAAED